MPAPSRPHSHLPRLAPEHYRGRTWVHWTIAMQERATGWLNAAFDASFRDIFARAAYPRAIGCLAYCLMPDHAHMLLCGLREISDQKLFVRTLRRETWTLLQPHRWQKQSFDHVLRENERNEGALLASAHYILENPVRAGLVSRRTDWPFRGAWLPGTGWIDPCVDGFGAAFWSEYNRLMG